MERVDRGSRPTSKGAPGGGFEVVRVELLGGFRVRVGTRVIEERDWRLRKAGILIAMLALAPGHRLHRERIMDLLWPDLAPEPAANNFHRALHAARRALNPDVPAADSCRLRLREGQLALCPGGSLRVDVEAFEEEAAAARRSRDPAAYRAAIGLYTGDLLPGHRYGYLLREQRGHLRRSYVQLLVELAGLHEERGEYDEGIEVLKMAGEPAHEETHVALMRLYALSGRREEALRQYERLEREVEGGPPATARRLHDVVAAGKLPANDSRGESPEPPVGHNLPEAHSSFVGRRRELVEVRRSLARTALLTLTGAGGCGKTRLALEAARDLVGAYPDGVWLVELAPLSDPDLVPRAVASALGVRERPGRPTTQALSDHLKPKQTLLLLDNCEHLVDAAARLAEALLVACPKLRVLATSREPLGVPGEAQWPVPNLSLPDGKPLTTEGLMRYEAVRLFVERARARLPDFRVTPHNAPAVANVCRKLDGTPLAIELAAARMGALAVEQVAQRLDDSLGLLTGGRTTEPRHRTLRATLDWSHDLLDEAEKALFRRLSVFVAGFTLAAAEKVCAGDGVEEGDVLPLLSRLVDKSLVLVTGLEGEPRYRLLAMVRQYAGEKLRASGEEAALRSRHAAFYLGLAERAEPELTGSGQEAWLDRLESDLGNLRAAVGWFSEGPGELGLRLAGALWRFCYLRGHYEQGRDWLENTLALDESPQSPPRAKALTGAGVLALLRCEYEHAEERLEEGLAVYRRLDDERGMASALQVLGSVERERGSYAKAEAYHEESLALWRALGDEHGVARSLNYLGFVAWLQEKYDRAAGLCADTLTMFRRLGDAEGIVWALISLGSTSLYIGNLARAEILLEEGLAISRRVGYREGVAWSLNQLGVAAYRRDDHERAETLLRESLTGHSYLGDRWRIASVLEGLAQTAGARGHASRASRLFGAAHTLRENISTPIPPCERAGRECAVVAARGEMGEIAFEAAYSEGRLMAPEQAVECALRAEEQPQATVEPHRAPQTLTRRQREVALLVARGLTNRRIAEELAISENTVANHVAAIIARLQLPSRARIASWVTERRPRATE